ncbi:DUF305 domain-containing protein [Pseudonocardia oroxyli]|uniref:Uncharacterized conserved protein, DUF305 family n=1 Tax=Pseudonocardia oroxyli TaxID=366584 RepID=A0A1G7N9R6_PSEOR|nr:DUF305 domain-containing protein [Pseudonocardia oroxyli]SDF70712.1 Uncharacterized conserved protein, DUF305 family [Pseudonocardia oroxyli]
MSTATESPVVEEPEGRAEPRWVRPLVVIGAVLALLLLGGAGGLLLGRAGSDAASVPSGTSVDVQFAQDMSVHHEQAVQMAAWERDHTTDPALTQLSYDIETTQLQQIGRMQGWLGLWGQAAFPVGRPYMTWMSPDGMAGHGMAGATGSARMPGMASDAELAALRSSTGPALDVLFLQLMLRHHQGGVAMLQDAAARASVPEVRNLAAQMLSAQQSESDYMTSLLARHGAQPLPMN